MTNIPFKQAKLSVVIPVFNNENTLEELATHVFQAANPNFREIECIFVNDASMDSSRDVLIKMAKKNKNVKVINFTRNFGQHVSLITGMRHSTGDYIFCLDADLEDDPKYLSLFMEKMGEGYEIVMATRKEKTRNPLRVYGGKLYSFIYNLLSDYKVIHNTCAMRLMTRKYVNYLMMFKERPWIGGFNAWIGLPIGLISVSVNKVRNNRSNYNFFRLASHARLGIIGFSTKVLRLTFVIGLLFSSFSFVYGLFIIQHYFTNKVLPGFTTLVVLISFLMGVQFMFLGIIGEYIAEIFLSTKNRPENFIYDKYNFEYDYLSPESVEALHAAAK